MGMTSSPSLRNIWLKVAMASMKLHNGTFEVWNEPNLDFWGGEPAGKRPTGNFTTVLRAPSKV